ncbi:CRISPR-associated protein Csb2 [Mycobacterium frederiksbergense]|uniref:CRISPR-associated protein Csb2 n=1 Tax=Mycolicibacterium frederiksbergense TaxID=117567 RepID=A0ABT6L1A2_9MYCO|nr:type I-U CRISPR-associated protein Csb2 [Mycolicibacterium frederiksbergense]MDH6196719.1 CRISPR-associated protein Csb2 [Mycolicibacterium frederiksbergense]
MSITGIRARFPLGVYVGHRPDGSPDPLPSTLRLHAALVAAASAGSSAEPESVGLTRTAAATRALEWIEDNPPDFVELPPVRENSPANKFSYRDEGVVEKVGKAPIRRKTQRAVGTGTAVSAPIGWGWETVPEDVAGALAVLCEDVPSLGEADSPVVLEFGQITPTHRRSSETSPFARAGIRIATPIRGRLDELDELHSAAQPAVPPSVSKDRWVATELPTPPRISHTSSFEVGYDVIGDPAPRRAPWRHVIHIGIDMPISNSERVAWSVALHRAMVSALDTEASAVITGRYAGDIIAPANRVAIQPVDAGVMNLSRHPHLGAGIAVLVPDGALDITNRALVRVTRLYRRGNQPILLGHRTTVDAATFWRAPDPDMVRVWESLPAVMPETRRPRRPQRRTWTLAESALLSVGFVFRDELPPATAGVAEERYAAIVDAVESRGVTALATSPIPDADVRKYAHKMPEGVVAQPYRLQLDGGTLLPEQGMIAVGQSRHLGGGLLCPVDRPASLRESWSVPR